MRGIYRSPQLDHVEDVQKYHPGGYHPVNLQDILDSRYKIVHKLGHGGFATVWLARSLEENRYVAVKIIMADAPNNELKVLTYLRDHGEKHPNIASLRDIFTIQGPNGLHQCLVFDVAGPSLNLMANRRHQLSGPMTRKASQQIAEGLAHLHSTGICHGDLTSSNVLFEIKNFDAWSETELYQNLGYPRMATVRLLCGAISGPCAPKDVIESIQYSNVDEEWLTGRVHITDLGESFFINDPPIKRLRTPVPYVAPETLFGWTASAASDVWALGCLIFELQASRPMIIAFFGTLGEALGEVVRALGPFPEVWRHLYFDKNRKIGFKPGQEDPWFDFSDPRYSLELMIRKIRPSLTAKETTDFLALLKAILEYKPSDRLSAKQIALHPWFVKCVG